MEIKDNIHKAHSLWNQTPLLELKTSPRGMETK